MDLSRIEAQLEVMKAKQVEMNSDLRVYNLQLSEHMRRTDLIEKRLDSIWSKALIGLSIMSATLVLLKNLTEIL